MPTVTIDNQTIAVPPGATVLSAARQLGIFIPTLCHVEGLSPRQSCLVCVVEVAGRAGLVPACAMPAEEGMRVVTDSPAVRAARLTAIELLLSEHLGECRAPCELACPAHWPIAEFMLAAQAGDLAAAGRIARAGLALPGVLGRLCAAPCQKACRRAERDAAVSIRELHRLAAEVDAARRVAAEAPTTDARPIVVVGAGPAGLSAAHRVMRHGRHCVLIDAAASAGGSLCAVSPNDLPPAVFEADAAPILAAAHWRPGVSLGRQVSLTELRQAHAAVILALGAAAPAEHLSSSGVALAEGHVAIDRQTRQTTVPGVFAAGACAGLPGNVPLIRVIAQARAAADAAVRLASGRDVDGSPRLINLRYGPLEEEEIAVLWAGAGDAPPAPGPIVGAAEAARQASRCLVCGCRGNDRCRLRQAASALGARVGVHVGQRRRLMRDASHRQIVHEPHKCILCGTCVEWARQAGHRPGLSIVGRGFAARVAGPYEAPLGQALGEDAAALADICPTRALHAKRD